MRAVRWHGRGDVRVEDVADPPPPGPGEVLVRVAWCGLCGSDVHEYRAGPFLVPVQPHPLTGRSAPLVLGHEVSGWVERLGDGVDPAPGLRPGALVALNAILPCGECTVCAAGAEHRCPRFGHLGMSADGGLAERVLAPASMVVPAPPGLPADVAALAEPFAVAAHALAVAGHPGDERCLVLGAGTIGLATALQLRVAGNEVVLVDVARPRLEHAERLGFRALHRHDVAAAGVAGTASVVVECSGATTAPSDALALVANGGLVVLVGLPERPVELDLTPVVHRELRVVGSMSHQAQADMVPALAFLAAHTAEAASLVTARVPLESAVTGGLDALVADAGRHAKVLVRVHGG